MKEVLDFFAECQQFFMATTEGVAPRVRPMGLVFEHKGKLYFGTNNKKPVWKQLKANPQMEVCASNGKKWLRLSGKIGFDSDKAAREKALELMPGLKSMYSADDGLFEVFYFESATGAFEEMGGTKKEIKI
jgi:uncharacterized pyridoxamine 5'-phosphate oxidase family protein